MTRTYAFFLQDEQQLLLVAGSKIIEHLILSLLGEEGLGLLSTPKMVMNRCWQSLRVQINDQ
jgi:hypothetical protein